MKRYEEIKEAAIEYSLYTDGIGEEYNSTEFDAFRDGAEWADNHPENKRKTTMSLWVASDKDGLLYLYIRRPTKEITQWKADCIPVQLDSKLFQEVKWEDEEPTEVELVIKKME